MADITTTITNTNTVLAELSLTTSAKEYAFVVDRTFPYVRNVFVTVPTAWLWANSAAGPWMPVGAGPSDGWEFAFKPGTTSIFMKMATGTGITSSVVTY